MLCSIMFPHVMFHYITSRYILLRFVKIALLLFVSSTLFVFLCTMSVLFLLILHFPGYSFLQLNGLDTTLEKYKHNTKKWTSSVVACNIVMGNVKWEFIFMECNDFTLFYISRKATINSD